MSKSQWPGLARQGSRHIPFVVLLVSSVARVPSVSVVASLLRWLAYSSLARCSVACFTVARCLVAVSARCALRLLPGLVASSLRVGVCVVCVLLLVSALLFSSFPLPVSLRRLPSFLLAPLAASSGLGPSSSLCLCFFSLRPLFGCPLLLRSCSASVPARRKRRVLPGVSGGPPLARPVSR